MGKAPPTVDGYLLLGWMEKDEAVYWLRNDCWFETDLTEEQATETWEKYRQTAESLPERTPKKPDHFPIPLSVEPIVKNFLARTKGSEVVRVANLNPLQLLVYQLYVVADRADHHAKSIGGKEWAHCCLQLDRPIAQMPLRMEDDVVKVTLPHGEHVFALTPAGFQIQQAGGWISVCEMQGRMILKAGYHRSFAFSRRLRKDPEAKEKSLLVAVTNTLPPPLLPTFPKQGLRTTVLGSRAPVLSDFFDESLAMAVKLRKKRYEMHIKAGVVAVNET